MDRATKNSLKRLLSGVLVAAALLGVQGCVTTVQKPFSDKEDDQRLLETSISAAISYIGRRDSENARRHLDRATQINNDSAELNNAWALWYQLEGEPELEEKHYKKAIRKNRDYSQARNNYGAFLYRSKRYAEAMDQLEKAAADPLYDKRAQAYENIGLCALRLEDKEKAEKAFDKAVRLESKLPRSYLALSQIELDKQNYVKAHEYLEKFDEIARHTPQSLWLGIQIQRILGDKDALASYELALKKLYPYSEEYRKYKESSEQ